MLHDALHQPLAQPTPAITFQHEHVAKIGYRGVIADHSRKSGLRAATIINAKTQGMLEGSRHNVLRDSFGPITTAQKTMDDIYVKPRMIGADKKIATPVFHDHRINAIASEFHAYILTCGSRPVVVRIHDAEGKQRLATAPPRARYKNGRMPRRPTRDRLGHWERQAQPA